MIVHITIQQHYLIIALYTMPLISYSKTCCVRPMVVLAFNRCPLGTFPADEAMLHIS